MKIVKYSVLLAIFLYSISCFAQQNHTIRFIQNEKITELNSFKQSLIIEKKPFAIRFFCKPYDTKNEKFYATQIAVIDNEETFNKIKIGDAAEKYPFFEAGTGMAPNESGFYDAVFINNEAHHYIYYDNESDKRANLISKQNDIIELEWQINKFFYNEKEADLTELPFKTLFFVIFIDANLNKRMEQDEIHLVQVQFK